MLAIDRQGRAEFLTLMAAAAATVAIAVDAMLPALADVREYFDLAPTSSDAALLITIFIAGIGIGQLVYGPLADRFGRKPVFMAGLLLYVLAGFATTMAPSLGWMLVGRFLWGLGAAGPRIVSQAMLRDRFRGDVLARAMAIILTVFLIVPTLAPLLGQAVVQLGSWRWAFAIGPVFGTLVALWSTRVSESLEPSLRRPLRPRSILLSVREVISFRTASGNTIALMLMVAAFLPYLASSERMFGQVYDHAEQFAFFFAGAAIVMAGFTLTATWMVRRFGTRRTTMGTLTLLVAASTANVVITLSSNGVPPFAFFVVVTTVLVALNTALTPLITSRALDDVGHIAGTAASTIGAISFIGGSLLSPIVDRAIETTVTPFAVGFLLFSLVAAGAAMWADTVKRR